MMGQTSEASCRQIAARSAEAASAMRAAPPADRARWLESVADSLDARRDDLVPIARAESHLTEQRLVGELARTTFQLRLFADVVRDGSYLDARIDHAEESWGMGPRPELRRIKRALGPVIVFAASNFPFAFSVVGGDSASALAAGCPVIVKAHEAHPELSRLTAAIVIRTLAAEGAPDGAFALIEGIDAGIAMLQDERVAAGGFTGSVRGGRALFDIAVRRPVPIPFYAEMGSVNPVVVIAAAAATRGEEIATGLIGSMTVGGGQFCTKPGLVFAATGSGLAERLSAAELPPAGPMLTERIAGAFREGVAALASHRGVRVLAGGSGPIDPVIFRTDVSHLRDDREAIATECFGPSTVLVDYRSLADVIDAIAAGEGQLTGAIFGEPNEVPELERLVTTLADRTGRVLWNAWPTGVSVTYAQQHGGPYPATSLDTSTSVGTAAIERWLRPVAFQNLPDSLLPPGLQDENPWGVPRHVR